MAEMVTEQGAPAQQGADVMKDAVAGIMQQAQSMQQAAEVMAQSGAQGPAQKIQQAAALVQEAVRELGVGQAGPEQAGQPVGR